MIKDRIIQLLEFKGIAKESFYLKIGMTSASFRGKAKETPLNSNAIANILSEVPDVNIGWLLTGNGKMLKNELIIDKPNPLRDQLINRQDQLIASYQEKIEDLKKKNEELTIENENLKKAQKHDPGYGMVAESKQKLSKK